MDKQQILKTIILSVIFFALNYICRNIGITQLTMIDIGDPGFCPDCVRRFSFTTIETIHNIVQYIFLLTYIYLICNSKLKPSLLFVILVTISSAIYYYFWFKLNNYLIF